MGEPNLQHLSELLDGYPGFLPGLAVTIVVAAIGYRAVARRLGIGRAHGFLLLFGVGVIVSATLFPNVLHLPAIGYAFPAWSCDLSRLRPSPGEFLEAGEATANMLLFLPLGIAIGLLPGRSRWPAAAVAIASPFLIELIQAGLPALERRCQTADIADNLTGLLVGLAVGAVTAWIVARRRAAGAGGESSTPEAPVAPEASVRRP
jgi:glycopeptide antibiotics resistance protein